MKLLQVDFDFNCPFGEEMTVALSDLAHSICKEPGLIWKVWTESEQDKLGGGIYLFADETSAKAYLKMHSARLQAMGIKEVRGVIFDVNQALTTITKGPLSP